MTLRVRDHVWNLRSGRSWRRIRRCFERARDRFGCRLVQFAVMGNHLHLIIEADDSGALSRAMQGLCIRIAKALNAMMGLDGAVFSDHYWSRLLRTPTELLRAIAYVLGNQKKHYGTEGSDRFSSAGLSVEERERVLAPPLGWLLLHGWKKARVPVG